MLRISCVVLLLVFACSGRLLPGTRATRVLQDEGCPPGCAEGATCTDSRCSRCVSPLLLDVLNGTCACAAGTFAGGGARVCEDCPKGSYCPGGIFDGVSSPGKVDCGGNLTTLGRRAANIRACVNEVGCVYAISKGIPSATLCPVNTFSPGLKKQRTCLPCPTYMSTDGNMGQSSVIACSPMPGYFLKTVGTAAPCPRSEFRAAGDPITTCRKCTPGVSTAGSASANESACNMVMPGFYPARMSSSGAVTQVLPCPQGYYCSGGTAWEVFNPWQPVPSANNTVTACVDGSWTQALGATNINFCLTPPGHKTVNGTTTPCEPGQYRAGWGRPATSTACKECGAGISSEATEEIVIYAVTPDATMSSVVVRSDPEACYVMPGQGCFYSVSTGKYSASNCDKNSYGLMNIMYGLQPMPCVPCPAGMITSVDLPNSARFWASNGGNPPRQGFTDPLACVTPGGYGYDGLKASRCPAGSFNPPGGYGTCTQCPIGLSTPRDPAAQMSIDNCTIGPGFGFHNGAVRLCPIGTYNSVVRPDRVTPCTPCPTGLTTSQDGVATVRGCDTCLPGFGGANCATQCGGSNGPNYAPVGQTKGTDCLACPSLDAGWGFDYRGANQPFNPPIVARLGADSRSGCLTEFLQFADPAWYMGGNATLTAVPGATTLDACVTSCKAYASCQYLQFDYAAGTCALKLSVNGTDLIAYKVLSVGDALGSSARRAANTPTAANANGTTTVRGAMLGASIYTYWAQQDGTGIGAGATLAAAASTSIASCCSACDDDYNCVAVVMNGVTSPTDKPSACWVLTGDPGFSTWKRGLTHTNVTRLSVADAFAALV